MPYKIRLMFKLEPEYIISREKYWLTPILENFGDEPFPGGIFSKFSQQGSEISSDLKERTPRIPKINPGEQKTLDPIEITSLQYGNCWIVVEIITIEGNQIPIWRYDVEMKTWRTPYYVFRYEEMKILDVLKEILAKLDQINSKLGESK